MDTRFRRRYNAGFSEALYRRYLADFSRRCGAPIDMQIAQTPVFLPAALRACAAVAGREILVQLCDPARIERMRAAVPSRWKVPNCHGLPTFCVIDFAITRDARGELVPKLIELQGFPTLIAYETMQHDAWAAALQSVDGLDLEWTSWFSGLSRAEFLALAQRTILGGHAAENVVLLDLDPPSQKTYPDFSATHRLFGIDAVCPTDLVARGRRLYRTRADGREVRVERIYNRLIADELERKRVALPFDLRDELEVEWTPHPDWYWIWSKYSLPFLEHPAVPRARFLSDVRDLPPNLAQRYVLKPLFSFAGSGVNVAPTAGDVAAIEPSRRHAWCLQEKIDYAAVLEAVDGAGVKVELRLIYLRPEDDPAFTLAQNLCRLSRGAMMGVDHNKEHTWVGSSIGIWPAAESAATAAAVPAPGATAAPSEGNASSTAAIAPS
ncbi:MAG: hypothetical protein JOZ01_08525, partial [Candidatus Eremiobacteraeota bacterium]|nr:hypothetical protein [Candidatus Eremiobacteraeota bacterium]